jgi:GNAT superfamily N-acetyltransferase
MNVQPLTPERWSDFVDLFSREGPRGGMRNAPAYGCWCMYWRDRSLEHGEPKRRAMEQLVRDGREPGLLAYDDDGAAAGWIAVAPREQYAALLASPQYRPRDDDEDVWSITCFVVDKPLRRDGIAAVLLDAAVEYAFRHNASSIEAYPHVSDGKDYMGGLELYLRAGFATIRDANKRAIVRRGR